MASMKDRNEQMKIINEQTREPVKNYEEQISEEMKNLNKEASTHLPAASNLPATTSMSTVAHTLFANLAKRLKVLEAALERELKSGTYLETSSERDVQLATIVLQVNRLGVLIKGLEHRIMAMLAIERGDPSQDSVRRDLGPNPPLATTSSTKVRKP